MAAPITAADITVQFAPTPGAGTIQSIPTSILLGPARTRRTFFVSFPNTAGPNNDYVATGVPLTDATAQNLTLKGRFGFQNGVTSLRVIAKTPFAGNTNSYWIWNGNPTDPRLVAFDCPADAGAIPMSESVATGIAQDSQQLFLEMEGY